jgi:hypothetical protein
MDKDSIYKTFQEICRQIPVVILGSGPSCAVGIPGMEALAEHLLNKLHNNTNIEWKKIRSDLQNKIGLETALSNNPPSESLNNEIIQIVGHYISKKDKELRNCYFNDHIAIPIEWLINYFRSETLTIITPNYDCLIEYCCDKLKIPCYTGFVGYFRKTRDFERAEKEIEYIDKSVIVKGKRRLIPKTALHVRLFKVHGSIEWYEANNKIVSDISLADNSKLDNKRLIIPPGYEKYSNAFHDPFIEFIQKANDSIRSGKSFLMIGYGFNDDPIEGTLVKRLGEDEKAGIIITKELSEKAKELLSDCPNLWGVSQKNSATVIHCGENEYEIPDIELWQIDKFVREILGG